MDWRTRRLLLLLVLALNSMTLHYFAYRYENNSNDIHVNGQSLTPLTHSPVSTQKKRNILIYGDLWMFINPNVFIEGNCEYTNCQLIHVKPTSFLTNRLSSFSSIVHVGMYGRFMQFIDSRNPVAPLIFGYHEPPFKVAPLQNYGTHMFHFSMAYTESRQSWQIGNGIVPRGPNFQPLSSAGLDTSAKERDILWLVSNCDTRGKREIFVQQLREALTSTRLRLDQYGKCNNLTHVERNSSNESLVFEPYSFYLAFENSLCREYITEKFYGALNQSRVIPIVRGAPKRDYEMVAPPHSFIHVDDFDNVTGLASYLQYLKDNITAFNEYFWWQEEFAVQQLIHFDTHRDKFELLPEHLNPYCKLCKLVNTPNITGLKPMHSFYTYWVEGQCQEMLK